MAARALAIGTKWQGGDSTAHRRPIPDPLMAATALEHAAVVLHYDRDVDVIAEVTVLSTRWIIAAGSGHGGAS